MAEQTRLRPKYQVYRIDEKEMSIVHASAMLATNPEDVNSPFVLMPRKDPAAFAALLYYASCCEPSLANEIHTWLAKIADAIPVVFGTQGYRNFRAMRLKSVQES